MKLLIEHNNKKIQLTEFAWCYMDLEHLKT